jgi:tRNA (guanine37-N1)-methyltransferase
LRFDILTIFPEFFRGPLEHGIVRRAQEAELITVKVHDLRVFTRDRHKTVDDRPFGGGEGMVLKPEPVFECLEKLKLAPREQRASLGIPTRNGNGSEQKKKEIVILLSAQGRLFHQSTASELAQYERIVLICGRYEGVDERVSEHLADQEISVGDYVLSGGELPAAIIVDAVARLIPGALGNEASARQESFVSPAISMPQGLGEAARSGYNQQTGQASETVQTAPIPSSTCESGGLLDYPHYTRPADFRGMKVPEVLVSGNHSEIRRWRRRKALEKTLRNRPELLERVALSVEDRELIAQIVAEMRK